MKKLITINGLSKKLILVCFSVFAMNCSFSQTIDSTFDLYLLIGQSNMAGRGKITDEFKEQSHASLLMLDSNNNWVQAKHPLHFDKPKVAGVGPGLRFGMEMAKQTTKIIGLIPCAVGGTSINSWVPGGYDKATDTHPYDDAIARLKIALEHGRLKGVIWLQGESDSDPEKSKGYLEKLEELIIRIRTIVGDSSLPFVAGEIGHFKEQYNNINKQLPGLTSRVSFTAVVNSDGLVDVGDKTHFNSASADEYGKRFAEAMTQLLHKQKK